MISITPRAQAEVLRLCRVHNPARLRLGLVPGSCAQLTYTMEFDILGEGGDAVYHLSALEVWIAPDSLQHLSQLHLDYTEDLMGGSFRFHNPQAVQTCACGHSFSVATV